MMRIATLSQPEILMSAVETIARKLGGPIVLGRDVQTQTDLAIAVQRGLPLVALEGLARTGFRNREIELLVISRWTRRRRAALGRSLTTQESDRTIRLLRIQTLLRKRSAILTKPIYGFVVRQFNSAAKLRLNSCKRTLARVWSKNAWRKSLGALLPNPTISTRRVPTT